MSNDFFQGRAFIVTGATSGIGFAIAKDLASLGAIIGIHHRRDLNEVQAEIDKIQSLSPKSISLQGDLQNPSVVSTLVESFVQQIGRIDGLVNNAGAIYEYGDFLSLSSEAWQNTFAVNTQSPFEWMRAVWPHFLAEGGGRIVNISSATVGYSGSLRSVHYVGAKAALEAISKVFAKDGVQHNILVNTLRLGLMDTPMHTRTPGYTRTHLEARAKIVPLGRMGTPEEAAHWVRQLLGENGAFMTGQTISLSGGD